MKKALIVLLILAVAGGMFAQTVTWTGDVEAGFGIGMSDMTDAKPKVDYIRNRGEHGLQANIGGSFTSADDAPYGKFGAAVGVRATAAKFDGSAIAFTWEARNVWWQPNSLLYINLGSGDPGGFGTMGGIDANNGVRNGDAGLKIGITPLTTGFGLSFGAHLGYGQAKKLLEEMDYRLGAKFSLPDLLAVVANMKFNPSGKAANNDQANLGFGLGASFVGLKDLGLTKIAADLVGYNFLNDKANFIGIGETVGFGLGGLTLSAKAQQFIGLGKDLDSFIPMLFHGEVGYKVNDVVSLGVEGRYVMGKAASTDAATLGAVPSFNYRNAGEAGGIDAASSFASKDNAYLAISPKVTLSVGPTITLGYNLQSDMSKDAAATATHPKLQHLIYATTKVSF